MRALAILIIFLGLSILSFDQVNAQGVENKKRDLPHRHAIDICPIAPLFNIYAVHYRYSLTEKDELIAGLSFMNIQFEGVGESNSPALILGYRRYVWKGLHLEYEIWPAWDDFWEKNERTYYSGFDLWNEFRLGYKFDFNAGKVPMFLSIQWPFGFGLYASNKPDSYTQFAEENGKIFYFPPLFFIGFKF